MKILIFETIYKKTNTLETNKECKEQNESKKVEMQKKDIIKI